MKVITEAKINLKTFSGKNLLIYILINSEKFVNMITSRKIEAVKIVALN